MNKETFPVVAEVCQSLISVKTKPEASQFKSWTRMLQSVHYDDVSNIDLLGSLSHMGSVLEDKGYITDELDLNLLAFKSQSDLENAKKEMYEEMVKQMKICIKSLAQNISSTYVIEDVVDLESGDNNIHDEEDIKTADTKTL